MSDITENVDRIDQLRKFVEFERANNADVHIADWALGEIERLRAEAELTKGAYASAVIEMHGLLMELGLKDCGFGTAKDWHVKASAEFEALKKDAERYRWLRDGGADRSNIGVYEWTNEGNGRERRIWLARDELDVAIDAALGGEKPNG